LDDGGPARASVRRWRGAGSSFIVVGLEGLLRAAPRKYVRSARLMASTRAGIAVRLSAGEPSDFRSGN
jgi:hypothetical protein